MSSSLLLLLTPPSPLPPRAYLQLSPFSVDDFAGCLLYDRDTPLLAEVHLALLRTIFGTPLSGGMVKNQVSFTQWRRALLEFLSKPKVTREPMFVYALYLTIE